MSEYKKVLQSVNNRLFFASLGVSGFALALVADEIVISNQNSYAFWFFAVATALVYWSFKWITDLFQIIFSRILSRWDASGTISELLSPLIVKLGYTLWFVVMVYIVSGLGNMIRYQYRSGVWYIQPEWSSGWSRSSTSLDNLYVHGIWYSSVPGEFKVTIFDKERRESWESQVYRSNIVLPAQVAWSKHSNILRVRSTFGTQYLIQDSSSGNWTPVEIGYFRTTRDCRDKADLLRKHLLTGDSIDNYIYCSD